MILFHGSPDPNLKVLVPKAEFRPPEMKVKPVVFATTNLTVAILMSRRWISGVDVNLSTYRTKKGIFIEEARPGGFEVFDGPAYIYAILDPSPFKPVRIQKGLERGTYISEKPAPVARVLDIPNVLEVLKRLPVKLVPFKGSIGFLSAPASQIIEINRVKLLEMAFDPVYELRPGLNETIWKAGKDKAWRHKGGNWFTLFYKGKPVAMACLGVEKWAGSISTATHPKHLGKGHASVLVTRVARMALERYGHYDAKVLTTNVPSLRSLMAGTAAMKALYGDRLQAEISYGYEEPGGPFPPGPALTLKVWLE